MDKLKIKRITGGEYVAINTLPTVRFSRLSHNEWEATWGDASMRAATKDELVEQIEDYATLKDVVVKNAVKIVGRGSA